jgi:hypothetical protein
MPAIAAPATSTRRRVQPGRRRHAVRQALVVVELKGGNDSLNVRPYADPRAALRLKLAIARDAVVQLSDRGGLHPSLAPLESFGTPASRGAGCGYPQPNCRVPLDRNLGHGAGGDEYVRDGWLIRSRRGRARGIRRRRRRRGLERSRPAGRQQPPHAGNRKSDHSSSCAARRRSQRRPQATALAHILQVESDIVQARVHLAGSTFRTTSRPTASQRGRPPASSPRIPPAWRPSVVARH